MARTFFRKLNGIVRCSSSFRRFSFHLFHALLSPGWHNRFLFSWKSLLNGWTFYYDKIVRFGEWEYVRECRCVVKFDVLKPRKYIFLAFATNREGWCGKGHSSVGENLLTVRCRRRIKRYTLFRCGLFSLKRIIYLVLWICIADYLSIANVKDESLNIYGTLVEFVSLVFKNIASFTVVWLLECGRILNSYSLVLYKTFYTKRRFVINAFHYRFIIRNSRLERRA